ncbi:DHHA1 domain-containing protein [Hahella sp. HN01]|uniref:DHH family phosphoesterase n=1 Tax=Hahella sp. HN01 TaxID=2847262 RepID=UPI001C1F0C3D|nr:phosphoesterase [Hahella sp. HN01]
MTQTLVIYHGNCLDGFGAAYAAYRRLTMLDKQDADYYAATHGEPPPDCAGKRVYLLDFCYKREALKQLCASADAVIVLDHHISAAEEVAGLDQECPNLSLTFDMSRSGAVIAWEYFHEDPPPALLAMIQDRDLWQWRIADSRDVNAALMSYPKDFEVWDELAQSGAALSRLADEGRAINRFREQMIEYYKARAVMGEIAGYAVPIVNCPLAVTSELLNVLAQGHPFAAGYSDKGGKRGWSLRSTEDGVNVADVAIKFGGGGHPRAAGFSTRIDERWLTLEPTKVTSE